MQLRITADYDDILRLEDENGASVTLKISGNMAQLLSILVPEEKRRINIGTELLSITEAVLADRGITMISADYVDWIEGMSGFLSRSGYTITETAPILSIADGLRKNYETIKRVLSREYRGVSYVRMCDMSIFQMEEMFAFLSDMGIEITSYDMAHFHQKISGAAYDEKGRLCSVCFNTLRDADICTDLLVSRPGAESKFTYAVIKEVGRSMLELGEEQNIDAILIAACSNGVEALFRFVLERGKMPDKAGICLLAQKSISSNPGVLSGHSIITETDDSLQRKWLAELQDIYMQRNVSWKAPWYRAGK